MHFGFVNSFNLFWTFLLSVGDHAITLAVGCVVTVVMSLVEKHVLKRPVSLRAEVAVLLAFIFFACFQAWRDEYEKASKVPTNLPIQVNVPAINVPPAQVIIERIGGAKEANPIGFLQLGSIVPVVGQNILAPGQAVAMNVNFENRGSEPVDDIHNFETLTPVDMTNPSVALEAKKAFRSEQQAASERSRGVKGYPIGAGQGGFNTARTRPLTQNEIDEILKGNVRLFLQVWAKWKDLHGNSGKIDQCWWLQTPSSVELKTAELSWHNCP